MKNYCGKDCESCAVREQEHCPGCADITGAGECAVGKCCRDKGHESCATCTDRSFCPTVKTAFSMPAERKKRAQAEAEAKARMYERAALLARWLAPLFWVLIAVEIAALAANKNVITTASLLRIPVYSVMTVLGLLHAYFLWKVSAASSRYRTAAGCTAISALISGILGITGLSTVSEYAALAFIIGLPAAIVSYCGIYQEYNAHSDALSGVDSELSEKWEKLWKWTIASLAGLFLAVPLTAILGIFGLLLMLVCAVASIVFHILSLVYLWRTVQNFKWLVARGAE